jgi:hypothetical protein
LATREGADIADQAEITPEARRFLEDALRPDVKLLSDWLGPTFEGWGLLSHS